MKRAKKPLAFLLAFTLMVGLFCIPAGAASFTAQADALKDMGLFQGTATGYQLDSAPNRAQAAVMLIRLLGLEAEVLEGTYEHPFTDVPNWADKQVGYMYEKGMTKGISATKFSSTAPCDANMYATFVLRAMKYSDTGDDPDFLYASALNAAVAFGVFDAGLGEALKAAKPFLRDHMVVMSFYALGGKVKGTEDSLLDTLVKAGAVDKDVAAKYQVQFDGYKAYMAVKKAISTLNAADVTIKADTVYALGEEKEMNALMAEVKVRGLQDPAKMNLAAKITLDGKTDINAYSTGGVLYLDTPDGKMKVEAPVTALGKYLDIPILSSFGDVDVAALLGNMSYSALALKEAKADDKGVAYTYAVVDKALLKAVLGSFATVLEIAPSATITVVYGTNGALNALDLDVSCEAATEGISFEFTANVEVAITYPAADSTITFPDFSKYVDMKTATDAA